MSECCTATAKSGIAPGATAKSGIAPGTTEEIRMATEGPRSDNTLLLQVYTSPGFPPNAHVPPPRPARNCAYCQLAPATRQLPEGAVVRVFTHPEWGVFAASGLPPPPDWGEVSMEFIYPPHRAYLLSTVIVPFFHSGWTWACAPDSEFERWGLSKYSCVCGRWGFGDAESESTMAF